MSLDFPYRVAADEEGNAYVTGFNSDNAFKITPSGIVALIS